MAQEYLSAPFAVPEGVAFPVKFAITVVTLERAGVVVKPVVKPGVRHKTTNRQEDNDKNGPRKRNE